jgi:hypothetical protein
MKADQATLIGSCLTVDLAEYKSLQSETVEPIKPMEAICVDHCLTDAFRHPEFAKGRVELFFDKDEPFIKFAERIWTRAKSGKSWASYV